MPTKDAIWLATMAATTGFTVGIVFAAVLMSITTVAGLDPTTSSCEMVHSVLDLTTHTQAEWQVTVGNPVIDGDLHAGDYAAGVKTGEK